MGFKMKGINSLIRPTSSNSPLLNTDPEIENTEFTTTKDGVRIPVARTITTGGGRTVEKEASSDQAFLDSFAPEFAKAKEGGFPGTLPEYIKQKEIDSGYAGSKVDQVRDYTSGLITKPGSEFHDTDQFAFKSGGKRYFKQREGWADGYNDEAFETGDFLAGLIKKGGGDGDAKNYITSEEAMRLYNKYNKQIDRPGQPKKSDMDPNDWTSIHNWNNWRKQRGLDVAGVSYQKGVEPTTYKDNDNLTEWIEKQNN